ncbi:MAG: VOC family protein [Opitutales bacterium]|jgi:catechol 2,3-dioxygenase-like lactoylglutathione lyase family enzyme
MKWALHHIGYLADDLEAEAARWVADFGYIRDGAAHEDPVQMAKVCFLRQPGASHWLELVSPTGPKSKLANAARQKMALHHVCYETDDLPRALASLRERGWLDVGPPASGTAFGGRPIAWVMDRRRILIEILQAGPGPYNLSALATRLIP